MMITEIRDRDRKMYGVVRSGELLKDTTAEIVEGGSIALTHVVQAGGRYVKDAGGRNVPNPEPYIVTKTFRIGDRAEVGSYNLIYTGIVRKITAKTITIVEHEGTSNEKVYRMSIYNFAWRNWDFDAAEAAKRNADWRD